jgi:hypothetical protein
VLRVARDERIPPTLDVPETAVVRTTASRTPVDAVLAGAASHDLIVLAVGDDWQLAPHAFGLRPERIVSETPASLLVVRGRS